jgi:hypothetical protein
MGSDRPKCYKADAERAVTLHRSSERFHLIKDGGRQRRTTNERTVGALHQEPCINERGEGDFAGINGQIQEAAHPSERQFHLRHFDILHPDPMEGNADVGEFHRLSLVLRISPKPEARSLKPEAIVEPEREGAVSTTLPSRNKSESSQLERF